MSKFIPRRVSDFFEPTNGKAKYTRAYFDARPGSHPVYSASLRSPFGHVDSYDFDGHYLTWVMNGYGGRVQEVKGQFSASRDRGIFVPKSGAKIPNLTYLRFALEPTLASMAVGRRVDGQLNEYTKIYPKAAETAIMNLPHTAEGELDFEEMDKVGKRLQRIESAKANVLQAEIDLKRAQLTFTCEAPFRTVSLGNEELFGTTIGSRLLLTEVNPDGVPAYSANVDKPFGFINQAPDVNFGQASLIWGIDGNFGWNLMPANYEFAMTDHCGRLEILDSTIDAEYLYYALNATRTEYGFDRVFRASLRNIQRTVTVPVPVDSENHFSIERQRKIAKEHRTFMETQTASLDALRIVLQANLGLDS